MLNREKRQIRERGDSMGIRSCLSRGSRLKFLFIGWVRICPQGSAFLTAKYAKHAQGGFHGNSFVSFVWFAVENPLHPLGLNLPARVSILNRQIRLIRESGIPWEFVRVFRVVRGRKSSSSAGFESARKDQHS